MPRRYHSSTAVRTVLSGGISNSDTIITVDSVSGFPGTKPYTLILDFDTVNEEIVTVTGGSGTSLNVTRGEDGTGAVSHLAGAVVVHGLTARDVDEPNAHINVGSGVHGATGDVVGTSDSQTLTNKTIDGGDNTLSNIPQSAVTDLESDLAAKAVYPSQTGNSGKVLGTNGSTVSWVTQLPGPKGDPGDPGAPGADGANGTNGADGVGVPTGGTTGQLLAKHSGTDFDTEWVTGLQLTDSTASTSTTTAATPNSVKSAYDLASAHKTRHATGGSDALSPSDIGAAAATDVPRTALILWSHAPSASVGTWSLDSATYWQYSGIVYSGGTQNDYIEWAVPLAAGTYSMSILHHKGNRGIYTISVDGSPLGTTIDGYNGSNADSRGTITGITIGTSGMHAIRFTMATKNPSAPDYTGAINGFALSRTGA